MNNIVLDSFAVMAFLRKEKEGDKVEKYLFEAQKGKCLLFLSYFNLAEVYYKTIREQGKDKGVETLVTIKKLPIILVSITDDQVLAAAEIKAGHSISLGDCFAVALAIEKKAAITTADREFKKVEKLVKIRWL